MPDYTRNLRLDRRLLRRRGWIDPKELQRELEALPDASDNIQPPEEEASDGSREPGSEESPPGA